MKTLIVIPAYNEERRLPKESFRNFITDSPGCSFLFVNDGSRDNTLGVLRELKEEFPSRVDYLDLPVNRGKAEAVRQGILASLDRGAQYVGFWDADLATPLEAIPKFEAILDSREGCSLVMGARVKLLGRNIERFARRHYLGRASATLISIVLGIPVYDTQCGAKLFRVSSELREIFSHPFLSRWVFDVEILARMIRFRRRGGLSALNGEIYELPLDEWRDITGSKVSGKDYLRGLGDLWKIYWGTVRRP